MERQQPEAAVVHLDVQLVDRLVAEEHLLEEGWFARNEALNSRAHTFLGQPAHFEQTPLQCFELLPEVRYWPFH